jgi:RNA polymerase sigma-70 factor (ECF subfamily)
MTTHALFGVESDNCADCSHESAESVARAHDDFASFYERFQPRLLRYARRVWGPRDAEEIAQETLVRAYEAIDLNRDERSLWGWLVVVGRNVAADLARARRLCDVGGETVAHEMTADPKCVEQTILDSECLSTLGLALSALPPSQSRAWWLSVAEGMTPTGIAESLACSPESVRQALFKSRKRLAAAMADFCGRTSAVVVPAAVLLRRGSQRAARQVAPAAAHGFLSAAMITTAAVGVSGVVGGTTGSAVVQRPATVLSAAHSAGSTGSTRALHSTPPRHSSRSVEPRRSAPAPSTAAAPLGARADVSSKPLAPGQQAHEHIFVDTPLGTFGVEQVQRRGPGDGLVCGRVDQVRCS